MTEEQKYIEQLMLERLAGLISEEGDHYLTTLFEKDEKVRQQWERIKETFGQSHPYGGLEEVDAELAWDHVRNGIEAQKRKKKKRGRWMAVAASLLIPLIVAGTYIFYVKPSPSSARTPTHNVQLLVGGTQVINLSQYHLSDTAKIMNNVSLQVKKGGLSYATLDKARAQSLNTLVIPPTRTYEITLSDGTEISLNAMSRLRFPFTFSGGTREVWLEGEAYFKVAKDEDHPFIVHTPKTDINVLGTSFNVNTYDSLRIKTALIEGAVSTGTGEGKQVILKPGYEAVFSPENGFDIRTFDKNMVLSWMDGVYYFRNTPLKDIALVVHRWYDDTIVFEDERSASYRFTGAMLKDKPLGEFLANLKTTSDIYYDTRGGVIHIRVK